MKRKFYEIDYEDLMGIDLLLESDYEDDWINIFVKGASSDVDFVRLQFNEENDLTSDTKIRISPEFAFKIWKMVEETDLKEVTKNYIKANENFIKQYVGES